VKKKVYEAYSTMKRWTKKIDLFSKEYIVIPINAYKHWNCMIVVSPGSLLTEGGQCKIIYLDSMMEKKQIFPEAIKV
jgi:Ulp1 family protease